MNTCLILGWLCEPDFLKDLISNLIATAFGAGLGFWTALALSKRQEASAIKEKRAKTLKLLQHELFMNLGALGRAQQKPNHLSKANTLQVFLKMEYWRAFSDSGELGWIKDPDLLGKIAEGYNFIRMILATTDRYYQLLTVRTLDSEKFAIREISELLDDGIKLAISEVELSIDAIGHELNSKKGRVS
jgi:hypothetical protein